MYGAKNHNSEPSIHLAGNSEFSESSEVINLALFELFHGGGAGFFQPPP